MGLVEVFPEEAGNPADWSGLSPASIWEAVEGSIVPLWTRMMAQFPAGLGGEPILMGLRRTVNSEREPGYLGTVPLVELKCRGPVSERVDLNPISSRPLLTGADSS